MYQLEMKTCQGEITFFIVLFCYITRLTAELSSVRASALMTVVTPTSEN